MQIILFLALSSSRLPRAVLVQGLFFQQEAAIYKPAKVGGNSGGAVGLGDVLASGGGAHHGADALVAAGAAPEEAAAAQQLSAPPAAP